MLPRLAIVEGEGLHDVIAVHLFHLLQDTLPLNVHLLVLSGVFHGIAAAKVLQVDAQVGGAAAQDSIPANDRLAPVLIPAM